MTQLRYEFDPSELRIYRVVEDSNGNQIDKQSVPTAEAIRVDDTLIDELINFGEENFPNLFTGVRDMTVSELRGLRLKLRHMDDALKTYQDLKETDQL